MCDLSGALDAGSGPAVAAPGGLSGSGDGDRRMISKD